MLSCCLRIIGQLGSQSLLDRSSAATTVASVLAAVRSTCSCGLHDREELWSSVLGFAAWEAMHVGGVASHCGEG
jgi:hypothetical protein